MKKQFKTKKMQYAIKPTQQNEFNHLCEYQRQQNNSLFFSIMTIDNTVNINCQHGDLEGAIGEAIRYINKMDLSKHEYLSVSVQSLSCDYVTLDYDFLAPFQTWIVRTPERIAKHIMSIRVSKQPSKYFSDFALLLNEYKALIDQYTLKLI